MKKFFVAMTALCLFAAIGTNAMAAEKKMKAGFDGVINLPMSKWADQSGIGIGALGVFEYTMNKKMVVTGRLGYIYGMTKEVDYGFGMKGDVNTSIIPLFGGIKYFVMKDVYVAGEAGFCSIKTEVEGGGSASETKLGITAGAGYEMGDIDIRGQLLFPSIADIGDWMGIMATVGYRFGL